MKYLAVAFASAMLYIAFWMLQHDKPYWGWVIFGAILVVGAALDKLKITTDDEDE